MSTGVILYGPPAAGKDTVTDALAGIDVRYTHFERLKAGTGRTTGYRLTTHDDIDALRRAGQIIWENYRYGATYIFDRLALAERLAEGTPVLHVGQVDAVDAITKATPETVWTVVYLWCPLAVAAQRIEARATGDADERLRAWDETDPLDHADVFLNTADLGPAEAAEVIHNAVAAQQRRTE